MRSWVAPAVLLIALVLIGATRWNVAASVSNSEHGVVIRWVQDRWTGDVWIRTYRQEYYEEKPSVHPNIFLRSDPVAVRKKRNNLTTGYYVVLGAAALWLLAAIASKPQERESS